MGESKIPHKAALLKGTHLILFLSGGLFNEAVIVTAADVIHAVFPSGVGLFVGVKDIEWIEHFFNLFKELENFLPKDSW